jgi:hypothetical protein
MRPNAGLPNFEDLQSIFAKPCLVKEWERRSAAPDVFRYWHLALDGQHYSAMLFWDSFMVRQ